MVGENDGPALEFEVENFVGDGLYGVHTTW
jgi:hypothetical protein